MLDERTIEAPGESLGLLSPICERRPAVTHARARIYVWAFLQDLSAVTLDEVVAVMAPHVDPDDLHGRLARTVGDVFGELVSTGHVRLRGDGLYVATSLALGPAISLACSNNGALGGHLLSEVDRQRLP